MKQLLLVVMSTIASFLVSANLVPLAGVERAEALPPPSGATSPAPLNNTFTAGEQIASMPANNGFESPQDPGTKVIPGWTIVGNPDFATTPSGGHSGSYYLRILGGGCLCPEVISSPFTLTSDGQTLMMWLNSFGSNAGAVVYVATAPYTNWNQIWSGGAGSSSNWVEQFINLSGYAGQTIELRLRADGLLGFDDIAWGRPIPNWAPTGFAITQSNVSLPAATGSVGDSPSCSGAATPASISNVALLGSNSGVTSAPFTVATN